MRNLRRRIEALEKSWSPKRAARRKIPGRALYGLSSHDLEWLVSAYAAERAGRPLTEREAAARQAYREALERECRCAGFHSASGFEPIPDIHQTITEAVVSSLDKDEFDFLVSAARGAEQGRPPTEQEAAARQTYSSAVVRLCQLAGFGSAAEFRFYEEPSEEDPQ